MGHDEFFTKNDRGIKACVCHEGSGTKLELRRVIQPETEEQHSRYVFFTFGAGTDGQDCDCRPPKLTRACSAVNSFLRVKRRATPAFFCPILAIATVCRVATVVRTKTKTQD